jgi:hypothetical protein
MSQVSATAIVKDCVVPYPQTKMRMFVFGTTDALNPFVGSRQTSTLE